MLRLTTYYLAVEATLLTCIQECRVPILITMLTSLVVIFLSSSRQEPGYCRQLLQIPSISFQILSDLPQLLQARTGILPSVTVDPEYFLSNFK